VSRKKKQGEKNVRLNGLRKNRRRPSRKKRDIDIHTLEKGKDRENHTLEEEINQAVRTGGGKDFQMVDCQSGGSLKR